jgi:spore maturation protein CgeB
MFALGFQSKANADDHHVSQRIYEGLAYGCVVLSNSEAARDQTDGIVEFVSSQREIEDKIDYYLKNKEEYSAKQAAGYHFIKTRGGTNHAMAQSFIDAINTAFPGIL